MNKIFFYGKGHLSTRADRRGCKFLQRKQKAPMSVSFVRVD